MTGKLNSGVYCGSVTHCRLRPVRRRFSYKVFSLLIDLDELDVLDRRLTFFSRRKFNLFSFHDRDHGLRDGGDVSAFVRGVLKAHGMPTDGRIMLLCYPRMLGYVFNPLAVYYCYDASDRLVAILHEVRNTFGGSHSYLIPVSDGNHIIRQETDKVFHVSPFMAMDTRYHFRLNHPGETAAVVIDQTDAEGPIFNAAFTGVRRTLDDRELLRLFCAYPLMTLKVIVGIHYEAARLLMKGMKLLQGAPDPATPVTFVAPRNTSREAA